MKKIGILSLVLLLSIALPLFSEEGFSSIFDTPIEVQEDSNSINVIGKISTGMSYFPSLDHEIGAIASFTGELQFTHPTLEGATKHARNNQIAQILYKIFRKNINFSTLAKSDLIDITLCVDQFMNPGTKKGTIVFIATVVAELIKQDNKRDT